MPIRPRKTSAWRLLCLGVLAAALAACKDDQTKPRASAAQATDWSDVTLILGDQAKGLRTVVEAAGTLADAPYKVQWANFQGAAPLFEALRAGAVDLAPAGDTPVLAAATGGTPLKIIAARRSSARGIAILVPPGSKIDSVADLKGRNVVVSSARGSIAQYLLLRGLAGAKVSEADVKVGFVLPTDALAAFNAGQIEAWATFGIYQAFAEEAGAKVLLSGEGVNSGLGFITAADSALQDPRKRCALSDLLRRFEQAFAWAKEHPDEYAEIFARTNNIPLNISRRLLGWGDETLSPLQESDIAVLQSIDRLFVEHGIFPHVINTGKLAAPELYPRGAGAKSCQGLTVAASQP